jgi:hypothetical protein
MEIDTLWELWNDVNFKNSVGKLPKDTIGDICKYLSVKSFNELISHSHNKVRYNQLSRKYEATLYTKYDLVFRVEQNNQFGEISLPNTCGSDYKDIRFIYFNLDTETQLNGNIFKHGNPNHDHQCKFGIRFFLYKHGFNIYCGKCGAIFLSGDDQFYNFYFYESKIEFCNMN